MNNEKLTKEEKEVLLTEYMEEETPLLSEEDDDNNDEEISKETLEEQGLAYSERKTLSSNVSMTLSEPLAFQNSPNDFI